MKNVWIIEILSLLTVSGKCSSEGVNHTVSVNSHTTPTLTSLMSTREQQIIAPISTENVREGINVNLRCGNSNWTTMIYVIWTLNLSGRNCVISLSIENPSRNTCNDRKALLNTTEGVIYLHVPQFSFRDEGLYRCETVFRGGKHNEDFNVSIIVPPKVTVWKERMGDRWVAVCLVEGGNPSVNISWKSTWNSSVPLQIQTNSKKFESRIILPEGFTAKDNLSCVVTHPYFNTTELKIPEESVQTNDPSLLKISVVIVTISIVMVTLGGLYFTGKLLCGTSDITSSEPKAAQPQDDVEEVEPYASYVQRVNCIYNSSAELFT
ncbi:hypothetical protein UPYG_G00306130 [Umbra pygmaea]|uniref:Ig-like domain-containing protein n=1 Tax=Umbra pygmaea TaxID=75934 RepID=A0ABD0VZS2_UMBPY